MIAIGFSSQHRCLYVVHVYKDATANQIHIVSARQATTHEEEMYAEENQII
jgi:uncharacterized DUF497 family protein